MISPNTFKPVNLLSHDDEPGWKLGRFVFTDAGAITLATMQPGYLVKFNATADGVLGAVAADDAALAGVIVDLGDPNANPTDTTVAVALSGSFDKRSVKYADGTLPISAAGIVQLRDKQIFLDDTTPTGAFIP
jgi:hypothetical protein